MSNRFYATLDPEDWEEFKKLGHKMLENSLTQIQNIREESNIEIPEESKQKLLTPLPEKGEGPDKVYNTILENLLVYDNVMIRPDCWAFVNGQGSPFAMLVDMIISGRNSGAGVPVDFHIMKQSLNWIKELLEIPQDYSATYVSGGSEANYTGLAIARNAKAEIDMKTKGMQNVAKKMVLYGSEEMHHCLERSVELLGLGNEALRWIPVDDNYSIRLDKLGKKIREDRENGFYPFCVIGCAGTVNTGAFDDLNALADLCQREDMWFHVDGAFGAWIKLSETHKHLADGLERADSIAVDMHKWMNMTYPIALTLVKDRVAHYSTFVYGHDANYIKTIVDEYISDDMTLWSSLALSRENYGLKAYMLLRAFGRETYSRLVQQNIEDAAYLAGLLEEDSMIELTAPLVSNIVCFRFNPGVYSEEELDDLNKRLLGELWSTHFPGIISDTALNDSYTLRACNINPRTRREDFDFFVREVKRLGNQLINNQ
jgi:glutamate/tyrosine decarboxylase-like PLP-dependent enzyme